MQVESDCLCSLWEQLVSIFFLFKFSCVAGLQGSLVVFLCVWVAGAIDLIIDLCEGQRLESPILTFLVALLLQIKFDQKEPLLNRKCSCVAYFPVIGKKAF